MDYKDQLQTQEWQRKKNSILERDNYQCRMCAKRDKFVHVHHIWYEQGKMAWEYDNECFVTLCNDCHKVVHTELPKIVGLISYQVLSRRKSFFDIQRVLEIL